MPHSGSHLAVSGTSWQANGLSCAQSTGAPMNLIATDFPGSRMQSLVSYLEHDLRPTIVLDTDYNIIAANTAYQRQFGVEGTPHVGEKCYRVSHQFAVPCDQAGEHCPMRKAHETRLPERLLHIHHTPRGPEHVDVELRPILD
ncbi:Sigma-54 dependent transcriptional regulator, partial [Pseudomonas syringae pv. atrofaciens]